jgi:hypothetical protein
VSILEVSLRFLNVFSTGIVAGGLATVLWVIVPVVGAFDKRTSVMAHQAMLGHQIDGIMKPLGIVSFLSGVAIVVLGALNYFPIPRASLAFSWLGILGIVGVIVTSRYYNVRTNRQIEAWSLGHIPDEYTRIRQRWNAVHAVRTSCGMLAMAAYLLALLLR